LPWQLICRANRLTWGMGVVRYYCETLWITLANANVCHSVWVDSPWHRGTAPSNQWLGILGFMNKMSRSNRRENVSIKQETGCAEPAACAWACLATKRWFQCYIPSYLWGCSGSESGTTCAARSGECTAPRQCGGSLPPDSGVARWFDKPQ